MTTSNPCADTGASTHHDLVISRLLRAPRAALWRAWSSAELLPHWWCPKPWSTEVRAFEFRPGGDFHTFMQGPDGGTSDNPGCFVDIVPQTRIVSTSTMTGGWRPATPWMAMTAVIEFADEAGGTRYTATVMHPDAASRKRHEDMGFFQGWNICIDQLDDFALTLR